LHLKLFNYLVSYLKLVFIDLFVLQCPFQTSVTDSKTFTGFLQFLIFIDINTLHVFNKISSHIPNNFHQIVFLYHLIIFLVKWYIFVTNRVFWKRFINIDTILFELTKKPTILGPEQPDIWDLKQIHCKSTNYNNQ